MRIRWEILLCFVCELPLAVKPQWNELNDNNTHLFEYVLDTINDFFSLDPFIWNTTENPTITMHFNYTTALVNGKLLTLLGKDPVEKNSTLFNVAVGHNNSYFVADLQSVFGESYVYNSSIKEQLTPNVNCRADPHCNDSLLPIEKSISLGLYSGDLQLMTTTNRSEHIPLYNTHEILQIHVIFGKTYTRPALMSSGTFILEGVESVEDDDSDKLLQNEANPLADLLKKLGFSALDHRADLICMPHEGSLCENAERCIRPSNSSTFRCICLEGFGGQYCQFSLLPPTCNEALSVDAKRKPGVYQIDIDGSGPLRSTFAECLRDGRTIVAHNAPNRTKIREPNDTGHKYYPITYKLFSTLQIKGLKKRSERCEQTIRYDCHEAPLDFKNKMTWFESDEGKKMYKLGSGAPDNGCVCSLKNECEAELCNCASSSKSTDVGTFFGADAGIQMLYVKKHEDPGNANITIGPLECIGDSGHNPNRTWTLKSTGASIKLGTKRLIRFFEMEFRTIQKDVPSLLIGDPIQNDPKAEQLQVSLSGGHKVEFKYLGPKSNLSITIMSQASLNDLKWHRLLIEIIRHEVRFSVENLNAFHALQIPNMNFRLKVGNDTNGLLGCVRGIRINNALVNLREEDVENEFVEQGCPNLCRRSRLKCEQNSRCIEHFDTGTTSCECKNNLIQYGPRCEKNINVNSEVSFHNRATGYLKFRNNELAANPLNTSIVFSVRTDQKRALFFYAHDQFDNFIQVHLENEYKIVLTLNNKTAIVRCSVTSDESIEFSNMRWLQIFVEHAPDRISLQVDDAICELPGPHVLSDEIILFYTGETGDEILPPQSAATVLSVQPYQLLFVGGVPRVALGRYPRYDELRRRERIAYYLTDIPALLGCVRGFMLGEQLDLRNGGTRPSDSEAVQSGCVDECKSLQCSNGGHCTVKWQEKPRLAECDCSKTSYNGHNCTKDSGVSFGGQSALVFNMSEPKRFFLDESEEQSFRFAFASRKKLSENQHLAVILFNDRRQFIVDLCRNGSINVVIKSPRRNFVYTFAGNFTDGFRHFFQAYFVPGKSILVLIDGLKRFLDEDEQIHLADSEEFWFGGSPDMETLDSSKTQHYYEDIDIDFHKISDTHFKPLIYYNDPSSFYHKSLRLHPDTALPLAASRCARFKMHGSGPMDQRNVEFPVWEAVFVPFPFDDSADDGKSLTEKYEWLILIGVGLLALLGVFLIVFCCYFVCCQWLCKSTSSKRLPNASSVEGKNANGKNHNTVLTDSITYMKPDASIPLLSKQSMPDRKEKEKTTSLASTGTYFTALENPPPQSKNMSESQITANALDSDDDMLAAYDDRPLSVISNNRQGLTSSQQIGRLLKRNPPPSLSTFLNTDELQPDHPLPGGRLSPYLPSLRSTLRKEQTPQVSPGQQKLISVQTSSVPSIHSLDSQDDSLKDL